MSTPRDNKLNPFDAAIEMQKVRIELALRAIQDAERATQRKADEDRRLEVERQQQARSERASRDCLLTPTTTPPEKRKTLEDKQNPQVEIVEEKGSIEPASQGTQIEREARSSEYVSIRRSTLALLLESLGKNQDGGTGEA
ncbi:hypothetical protein H2200_012739 [Cladophialophora chaetospira]|uniref:Uncharacterized protein n=1 Tax=Cladophialophora chaetospira TaxID=386627 RepID=A0AA39CC82_9EURO|nr:hypothetical protein H2200_012739 [Cladophialophora chaetospira]